MVSLPGNFEGWLLFLLGVDGAALLPDIEFGTQGIDRATLMVRGPMNRHSFLPLPSLGARHVPDEEGGYFLPGIEATLGRGLGQRFVGEWFAHSPSRERSEDKRNDCNAPNENCKTRYLAATWPFRLLLFAYLVAFTHSVRGVSGYD